ncbi:hypothetical protein DMENIID0001_108120 [Sergentomyia squamirostris]
MENLQQNTENGRNTRIDFPPGQNPSLYASNALPPNSSNSNNNGFSSNPVYQPWYGFSNFDPLTWNQAAQRPKLPPLHITKFGGQFKDWNSFIELFNHIIHNDPRLCDTERFQYLLSYLESEARRIVSHLTPTGDHYQSALNILKNRYENRRETTFQYVNMLLDAVKIEHRNAHHVINLHDSISVALAGLNSLKYRTDTWGPMIIGICIRKLDAESLRFFEETLANPSEVPTINQLLNFLRKRHQILTTLKQ